MSVPVRRGQAAPGPGRHGVSVMAIGLRPTLIAFPAVLVAISIGRTVSS